MNQRQASTSPADRPARLFLDRVGRQMRIIRQDMGHLIDMGQCMAKPLLRGGTLFAPEIGPFWHYEFNHRAGGFMGLAKTFEIPRSKRDVAYINLGDPRRADAAISVGEPKRAKSDPNRLLKPLLASPGQIFFVGRKEEAAAYAPLSRFSGFTGGIDPAQGWYRYENYSPLVSLRPFDLIVRGWIAAGELITACIRAGKMPVMWMSYWLEASMVRNAYFIDHNNLREPWRSPMFHKDVFVPPLAPGYAGDYYLNYIESLRQILLKQTDKLAQAGQWLAQARRAGKRIWAVAVGHAYPMVLELGKDEPYPLQWGWSRSDLRQALPADWRDGDVAVHLGYAPMHVKDVQHWLKRGVRLIHTTPFGRSAELKDHRNLLWLDLPWRPGDACVDIPAYSVKVIPSSSVSHSMAYFAMLAEMAEIMGWDQRRR